MEKIFIFKKQSIIKAFMILYDFKDIFEVFNLDIYSTNHYDYRFG